MTELLKMRARDEIFVIRVACSNVWSMIKGETGSMRGEALPLLVGNPEAIGYISWPAILGGIFGAGWRGPVKLDRARRV